MKNKSTCIHIKQFLNLTVVSILYLSQTTFCIDQSFLACEPKKCGNQTIKFPFYIEGEQESFCGYPGFSISCKQNNPILQEPQNTFQIQQIFYQNRSLHLLDTAILNLQDGCFPKINNSSSFDQSKFEFVSSSEMFLFSNCSSFSNSLSDYKIGCKGETEGFAMFSKGEKFIYAMGICKVVVFANVELKQNDGIGNYAEVLKRGFTVKWFTSDCGDCERSGGRCGFDNSRYHFKCFCTDRPHNVRCNSRVNKWRAWQAWVITAGGLVLVLVMCFLCYTRWRKVQKKKIAGKILSELGIDTATRNYRCKKDSRDFQIFSFESIAIATMNFSFGNKLGEGGFGSVYKVRPL